MKRKIIAITLVAMMLSGCGHAIVPDGGANVSEFTAVPIPTAVPEPAHICGSGNCRICGAHVEHQWVDGQCYCGAVQETSDEQQ